MISDQMLALSSVLLSAWVIWALSQNDVDDDNDGPGGGSYNQYMSQIHKYLNQNRDRPT